MQQLYMSSAESLRKKAHSVFEPPCSSAPSLAPSTAHLYTRGSELREHLLDGLEKEQQQQRQQQQQDELRENAHSRCCPLCRVLSLAFVCLAVVTVALGFALRYEAQTLGSGSAGTG